MRHRPKPTAVVIFEGDTRGDELRKSLPRTFLSTLHGHLENTIGSIAGVQLVVARLDEGNFSLATRKETIHVQTAPTLDHQLQLAFETLFDRGYGNVMAIGGDTLQLDQENLISALTALERESRVAVVGPAKDGGFYLVGANERISIRWSDLGLFTPQAFDLLAVALETDGFEVQTLEPLTDADSVEDSLRGLDRRTRMGRRLLDAISSTRKTGHVEPPERAPFPQRLHDSPSLRAPPRS